MKMIYNYTIGHYAIKIFDNDTKYHVMLSQMQNNNNKVRKEFDFPKNCTDANKLTILENIKKWYIANYSGKYGSPESFMASIENKVKTTFRIREWKSIEDLIKERDLLENSYNDYTAYIENYNQQKKAEQNNMFISEQVQLYNQLLDSMKLIYNDHPDVQYSFGLFRFKVDNKYNYIKFKRS